MTIDDWNPQIEAEIDDMYAAGISSFKMYMTYPAMMIGDNAMYHALKKLKEKGGICGVHCENSGVIDALIEEKKAAGEMGVSSHPRTRPDFLEAEAVSRLLRIAEAVDIPVVIVHLTNAAALREVEAARKRGQKVYAETCPQYLLLDDSVYDNPDYSLAARYVCAPPIRKTEDQKALWMALRRGEIQTISTDHCSFTLAQKDAGRGDFTKIPGGLPGVETRGELIYTAGVTTRKISLATMYWRRIPPSSTGCSPGRASCRPGPTPISWCTIRWRITSSVRRTWWPTWTITPTRASPPVAPSSRCGSGAVWRWSTAPCWPGPTVSTSPVARTACKERGRLP